MPNDKLSSKQLISMMIIFIIGSSSIMGINTDLKQDGWIGLLFACAASIPVVLIYSRILHLFPEKDIFDITEILVGKIGSKVFILIITWYSIQLGAVVLCSFQQFINLVDLPSTPDFVVVLPIILLVLYLAKSSMSTFGNWSLIALALVSTAILITIIFSLKDANFDYLLPVFNHSISEITMSSYKTISLPLTESVFFMAMFGCAKSNVSPYKVYIISILISTLALLSVLLRNTVLIGSPMLSISYYPSYLASRIISIGNFITRIEGTISLNFVFVGITKFAILIYITSIGLSKLFGIKNPKQLIVPSCLLTVALSLTSFKSIMENFNNAKNVFHIYFIPIEFIIPLVIWIIAEVRTNRGKKQLTA